MSGRPPRIAVLGGGMAGLAAAWRLSEPGWRDDVESITVYQRGWRLGGKGASSRGRHGRVEEHGLHVWLGWYENAFRLLGECYQELDRPTRRPEAPIRTLDEALLPAGQIGLADRPDGATWHPWVTDMPDTGGRPGASGADGGALTVVGLATQAARLVTRYLDTLGGDGGAPGASRPGGSTPDGRVRSLATGVPVAVGAMGAEVLRLARPSAGFGGFDHRAGAGTAGAARPDQGAADDGLRRTWQGVALAVAALRGIAGDRLLTDPGALARINDEEYLAWLQRHGGPADLADYSVVRSLYDMVFGFVGGDTGRPSFSAGSAVLFGGRTLFDYRGSVFWKMAAGMGDVVFAPLYEALVQRGVKFEFFHRVDGLHPSEDGQRIGAVTLGRQAALAPGHADYQPLARWKGLPCFPAAPLADQLAPATGIEQQPLESHWCRWPDAERRVLRAGSDFDLLVFAIPPAMAAHTCTELAAERPEWRAMLGGLGTVATQAFQVWLGESEADLGWSHPGSTLSSFAEPFSTWASMPQLVEVEDWPAAARPHAVAYFCGVLDAASPATAARAAALRRRVRDHAVRFLDEDVGALLPGAAGGDGFRWELLCGGGDRAGAERFGSQYWTANTDPSDRYVQSLPGTDRLRLRPDESGYENLFLAGDWTDCGLNAGCIEAAVLSGLQAANAVRRRPRTHRILGSFMP